MSARRIPSGFGSTLSIASLTWMRVLRGRGLWVSLLIAALPVMYAAAMSTRHDEIGGELFTFEILILSVLAPMLVGGSIAEEIEERTATYLWSRPLPRWSVLTGKLLALVPLIAAVVLASWAISGWLSWHHLPPLRSFVAISAGALAMSLVASGIATLAPKHGMALTICYMLFFDFPLGVLPATFREASLSHHVRVLTGGSPLDPGTTTSAVIGLVAISGAWALIAAMRVRRLET